MNISFIFKVKIRMLIKWSCRVPQLGGILLSQVEWLSCLKHAVQCLWPRVFLVPVFGATPNHASLKYRCPMKKSNRVRVGYLSTKRASESIGWEREREIERGFLELKEFALGSEQVPSLRKWSGFIVATLLGHHAILSVPTQEILDHPIWAVGNCQRQAYEYSRPSNQNIQN